MLRKLAILMNAGWLLFFVYLLFAKGMPRGTELNLTLAFVLTVAVNIFVLARIANDAHGDSLIGLYLQRLKMEQQRRISELQKRESQQPDRT